MAVEVLCGPVVRRVGPERVSVFLAVRTKKRVTLRVYAGENAAGQGTGVVLTGSADTVQLGAGLQVVTVSTKVVAERLTPGATYRYQVFFGDTAGGADLPETAPTLFTAGYLIEPGRPESDAHALLGYGSGARLPSFQVAPDDPAALRIAQVAGRRFDADGPDALAMLDERIAAALGGDGSTRPHLLVMTGDQVNADELTPTGLKVVRDALGGLGAGPDTLPDGSAPPAPGRRFAVTQAARFATPTSSHPLTFAEYAALHLLSWSPALWPAAIPTFEQVHPEDEWEEIAAGIRADFERGAPYAATRAQDAILGNRHRWMADSANLTAFRDTLRHARRALANTPVLTTPGDHEVSRGWNGPPREAVAMLGTPLGKRVIANGLLAHAVFQAWGNTPEAFEGTGAGATLLAKLKAGLGGDATAFDAAATAAGLPTAALVRPAAALTYHHQLSRPRWQLLVLDTQTQRGFAPPVPALAAAPAPPKVPSADPPAPVAEAALTAQLATLPAAAADALTIVVTGTPLARVPAQDQVHTAPGTWSWAHAPKALHGFLGRLLTQGVAAGADGVRTRRLVVLSNGQGQGFASRVRYSADVPYGGAAHTPADKRVEAVVAHLAAGPAHGTNPDGRRMHRDGYRARTVALPWREHVGWDLDLSKVDPKNVYTIGRHLTDRSGRAAPWQVSGAAPQVAGHEGEHRLDARPLWRFQVDHVRADVTDGPLAEAYVVDPDIGASASGRWSLAPFSAAARNAAVSREKWSAGTEVVGENGFSELTFTFTAAGLATAVDTRWWQQPGKEAQPLTRFTVPLEPGPSRYDVERYGSRALRTGDTDSLGADARYEGVKCAKADHVAKLREDLVALGFTIASQDPAGTFGAYTAAAVREFQFHARSATVAKEREYAAGSVPLRYVDRLQTAEVPEGDRYRKVDGVSGVVNRQTRRLITLWLANRWRCPLVVEALPKAGGPPTTADNNNLWVCSDKPTGSELIIVATDFSYRHLPVQPATGYTTPPPNTLPQPTPTAAPPAGAPPLPRLVRVGNWVAYKLKFEYKNAAGADVTQTVEWGGGQNQPSAKAVWLDSTEILPERLLPGSPTLAQLATRIAGGTAAEKELARNQLSTYKVVRAVAESETIGYFDGLNGYDNAFLSLGTCHWTFGAARWAKDVAKADYTVAEGELWGFLSLLRHRHRDEFDRLFGDSGLGVVDEWTSRGVYDSGGHKYTSTPTLATDANPVAVKLKAGEFLALHTWHTYYRFIMACRTSEVLQRLMWPATKQRIADSTSHHWSGTGLAAVADVAADRPDKRPMVREVFTSERAIAFIHRWHILMPAGMASGGSPGESLRAALSFARRGSCDHDKCQYRAAVPAQPAVPAVPPGPGNPTGTPAKPAVPAQPERPDNTRDPVAPWTGTTGPDFTTAPDTWTDAHESALIAGLAHRAKHHANDDMALTIAQVQDWPKWSKTGQTNPNQFQLPVSALPEAERTLKSGRGTFHFDSTDLPSGGPRTISEVSHP